MQVVEHAVALGFAEIRRYTQRPSRGKPATEVDNCFAGYTSVDTDDLNSWTDTGRIDKRNASLNCGNKIERERLPFHATTKRFPRSRGLSRCSTESVERVHVAMNDFSHDFPKQCYSEPGRECNRVAERLFIGGYS
jgi:hypothetical protein